MSQEIKGKQFSYADRQRLEALNIIQKKIDPFQSTPESGKVFARGLKNLFLRMADPSIKFVESAIDGLRNLPINKYEQLFSGAYDAIQNPHEYFTRHGIVIDEPEKLIDGVEHSKILFKTMSYTFAIEDEELLQASTVDTGILASDIHEQIQANKGKNEIRKTVEKVRNERNYESRYRLGSALLRTTHDFISRFHASFFNNNYEEIPEHRLWEYISFYPPLFSESFTELILNSGESIKGNFGIGDAIITGNASILRHRFENELDQLPRRDKKRFNELRLKFGAKGANIILLTELVDQINSAVNNRFGKKLEVPEFKTMPVELYRAWKNGSLRDDDLKPYYEWASGLKDDDGRYIDKSTGANYIVRSSAVFSEDGEKLTGAGVYDSVGVSRGASFEEFKNAVFKVFASTDSPRAQAYRTDNGIENEEMGIVLQKYVSPNYYSPQKQSGVGQINSRFSGVPQLMEIQTGTSRNFINRDDLDFFLALNIKDNKTVLRKAYHFLPDGYKVDPDLPLSVAMYTAIIEKLWGTDIQIEFVDREKSLNFVQVRNKPPTTASQEPEVTFPEETPIYRGASIGKGDKTLSVLDDEDNNNKKDGVVICESNYKWSNEADNPYSLPGRGAVIITNSRGNNGHIQTICEEKGLICVFPDVNEKTKSLTENEKFYELRQHKKVRIVSNGMEARVYGIKEDKT